MIIGLVGRARSGKDSIAYCLAHPLERTRLRPAYDGYPWVRVAFADPLKEAAAIMFRFSQEQIHGDLKDVVDPRWGFTPRHALRLLGTEVGRQIREDVWIRSAELKVQELVSMQRHVVVTDCRFRNEAEAIRCWGGFVIRVERDLSTAPFAVDLNHPSETELAAIQCDLTVSNDATLDELEEAIWDVMEQLKAVRAS